jgi:predicted NAD-dependent protein-ADP-ribosyltransferase YbiA (DUF1768 family)
MAGLGDVLTIQEVSKWWDKNPNTVRYHINRGNLRWRYIDTGKIVLVERASVEALWGPPVYPPEDEL